MSLVTRNEAALATLATMKCPTPRGSLTISPRGSFVESLTSGFCPCWLSCVGDEKKYLESVLCWTRRGLKLLFMTRGAHRPLDLFNAIDKGNLGNAETAGLSNGE